MLARLYSEHVDAQAAVRVENERRRKEVLAAVGPFTSALMDSVNDGVAEVFTNQRKIDAEAHELRAETQRFSKQTTKWLRSVDDFNNSLKELGDFENWRCACAAVLPLWLALLRCRC